MFKTCCFKEAFCHLCVNSLVFQPKWWGERMAGSWDETTPIGLTKETCWEEPGSSAWDAGLWWKTLLIVQNVFCPDIWVGPDQLISTNLTKSRSRHCHVRAHVWQPSWRIKLLFPPPFYRRVPVFSSLLSEERITAASLRQCLYWNPSINSPSPSNFSVVLPSGKIRLSVLCNGIHWKALRHFHNPC